MYHKPRHIPEPHQYRKPRRLLGSYRPPKILEDDDDRPMLYLSPEILRDGVDRPGPHLPPEIPKDDVDHLMLYSPPEVRGAVLFKSNARHGAAPDTLSLTPHTFCPLLRDYLSLSLSDDSIFPFSVPCYQHLLPTIEDQSSAVEQSPTSPLLPDRGHVLVAPSRPTRSFHPLPLLGTPPLLALTSCLHLLLGPELDARLQLLPQLSLSQPNLDRCLAAATTTMAAAALNRS
ncbi:hypothetical protein B296_00009530 [Ensete ventricosum]|uniref:Uncharacterized protein n=1 Tax=Ensete ventricosum TaxID=4639 RepID=A0A426ZJE8_ENSVE|nr:hypothetical protein B296_00009530 [Ensete ventricosum]